MHQQQPVQNAQVNHQPLQNLLASSFKPASWNGLHTDQAENWWQSFLRYCDISGINGNNRCNLLGLLVTGISEIWFNQLPAQTRNDFAVLENEFRQTYITPPHTQFERQMSIINRHMRTGETVDEFIAEQRMKMAQCQYNNELQQTLILHGLRPDIKSVVLQHQPFQDMEALQMKARMVEASLATTTNYYNTSTSMLVNTISDDTEIKEEVRSISIAMQQMQMSIERMERETVIDHITDEEE